MGTSNHNSDDTTFLVVLVIFALVILLGLPFCAWVYMETIEQRSMVEASIKKLERMQKQFEKDREQKEKEN
jgi:hypothetical protein